MYSKFFYKEVFISSASQVTYNLYVGTCKMESNESKGLHYPPVAFELNLPNEMNEVMSLIKLRLLWPGFEFPNF